MSHGDPIADMLTRIRNAVRSGKGQVSIRASKTCEGVAKVLQQEGYILGYDRIDDAVQGFLRVQLKYDVVGRPVINEITRISRPGCRRYLPVDKLPKVLGGMGIAVVSTSQGILSDKSCRQAKVGGEVLCTVS